MRDSEHYRFGWIPVSKLLKTRERSVVAICEYSGRIAKITHSKDVMSVMVIQDTIISDGKCEEEERCLDFDCPLNKTTAKTFARAHNLREKKFPADFGTTITWNKAPDGALHNFSSMFKPRAAAG